MFVFENEFALQFCLINVPFINSNNSEGAARGHEEDQSELSGHQ